MRPDLPWNVAGIPSEAREAARAAARREGLSVGEWLTRRILRSFADAGDEDELTRDNLAAKSYRPDDDAQRRDTDEMLERVSRSGSETSDVYRRIEEQLRGVARRMEAAERTQSEHNRVLSKAATEMNIAAREQAQAFDQLGSHVVGLADRIERVERANAAGGMKDAIKGLHTGLSRLADQITQNAGQSAAQVSQLANSLEALASRLSQTRSDSEDAANHLEARVALLDGRIEAVEKTAQSTAQALERALEKLDARAARDQESERREAATSGVIARLEENVARLEARGPDPDIEKRLTGIERNLGDLIERLDGGEPATARAIEDSLRKLLGRVEATENRQRDTLSEVRAALGDTNARLSAIEGKSSPGASMAASPMAAAAFAAPASFDLPPFPDVPTPGAAPPFAAQNDAFAAALDAAPPFPAEDPFGPAAAPGTESFLSAARRSAQAAATAAEAEQASRGFGWPIGRSGAAESSGRSRAVLLGLIVLIAVALIAAMVLSQSNFGAAPKATGFGALFNQKSAAPPPQEGTPLHALSPQTDEVPSPPAATPQTAEPRQTAAAKPLHTAPEKSVPITANPAPKDVRTAPVHAVPEPAQPKATAPAAPQAAKPQPALDRLSQLATAGNAKAQTIVGLKYLNGDGTPVNESQAAAWLEKAAQAGEPVAQYRLGTLYEHGKGVAADPVKASHWYLAAAMQGNRKAMHNIAVAFAEGTGVKKDLTEAVRWFSKAASLGLTDSQFNLAVLYERGQGVPQSLVDAYKWYSIAAAGGDAESKSRRDALATQLSADDRAAAQHAAESFRAQSPDQHANMPPQLGDLP